MFEAVGAVIAAILKVGVPIYISIFISCCLALFLPDYLAGQIGIATFRQLYRGYLGGGLIFSTSLLTASALSVTSQAVTNRLDDRRLRQLTLDTLNMLTEEEKKFLRNFMVGGQNTVFAPITDGVTGGLVAKTIIYRSSNVIQRFSAPYNLQPVARKLLSERPALLN